MPVAPHREAEGKLDRFVLERLAELAPQLRDEIVGGGLVKVRADQRHPAAAGPERLSLTASRGTVKDGADRLQHVVARSKAPAAIEVADAVELGDDDRERPVLQGRALSLAAGGLVEVPM